jgi:hypothetical protein
MYSPHPVILTKTPTGMQLAETGIAMTFDRDITSLRW